MLVNTLKENHLKKKNNNTIIFPNNINQNIFNCTITSREFNNLNNNNNIAYLSKKNSNKSFYINKSIKILNSSNFNRNSIIEKHNITKKKINRSSSIPEMINRNRYEVSLSNLKYNNTNKARHNSFP